MKNYYVYLLVMSLVTYLIRMIPFVLVKKKIKNRFLLSFLYYVPYAVLSVMTIPAIFYSTGVPHFRGGRIFDGGRALIF